MLHLSTTSLGTHGSFPWGERVKCLRTSKNSKWSRKDSQMTCTMSSVKLRQGKLLWCIHNIPLTKRYPVRFLLSTYTTIERSGRTQKSGHPRSSKVHLNEKHLPKPYWAKAENSVVYLMKRCTTSGVHEITPHEKYYGKKPNLSHIRIFVGYSLEKKWYKCLNPSTWKVRVSWDVVIDESASRHAPESTPLEPSTNDLDNTEDDWGQYPMRVRSEPDWWTTSASKQPKHFSAKSKDGQRKRKNARVWRRSIRRQRINPLTRKLVWCLWCASYEIIRS